MVYELYNYRCYIPRWKVGFVISDKRSCNVYFLLLSMAWSLRHFHGHTAVHNAVHLNLVVLPV